MITPQLHADLGMLANSLRSLSDEAEQNGQRMSNDLTFLATVAADAKDIVNAELHELAAADLAKWAYLSGNCDGGAA